MCFFNTRFKALTNCRIKYRFSLYESESAPAPLATQDFPRGEYSLDFDFSKSDGLSAGSVARLKVNFSSKLDLEKAVDSSGKPKELWAELSVDNTVIGKRERIPDEPMVKLLLASDASIATYLTLAYEGDENPITTIYKDLPISSIDGVNSLKDYFSAVTTAGGAAITADTAAENWVDSGANVYTLGSVGIGSEPGIGKAQITGGRVRIYSEQEDNLHLGFRNGLDETNPMAWMGVDTSGNYNFGDNNGNSLVTFLQNGNVTIGTTTSTYKLSVNRLNWVQRADCYNQWLGGFCF